MKHLVTNNKNGSLPRIIQRWKNGIRQKYYNPINQSITNPQQYSGIVRMARIFSTGRKGYRWLIVVCNWPLVTSINHCRQRTLIWYNNNTLSLFYNTITQIGLAVCCKHKEQNWVLLYILKYMYMYMYLTTPT